MELRAWLLTSRNNYEQSLDPSVGKQSFENENDIRMAGARSNLAFGCNNPLNTQRLLLYLKTQFRPRSKHISSWL
jgi:hypothetical protein